MRTDIYLYHSRHSQILNYLWIKGDWFLVDQITKLHTPLTLSQLQVLLDFSVQYYEFIRNNIKSSKQSKIGDTDWEKKVVQSIITQLESIIESYHDGDILTYEYSQLLPYM